MRLLAVLISTVLLCCQVAQAQVRTYDQMIAAGELKVAVYKDFAPYSFEDAGQPRGWMSSSRKPWPKHWG